MKAYGAALGLALLATACSPRACGKTKEVTVYKVISGSQLTFVRAEPKSAEVAHAASTRAGRVAVPPRALAGLSVVASIEDGPLADRAPRFVVVPSGAERLFLERPTAAAGGLDVRASAGTLLFARGTVSSGSHVLAQPHRYWVDGRWHDGSGTDEGTLANGAVSALGEVLATSLQGDDAQSIVASPSERDNRHPNLPPYTRVVRERPFDPEFLKQYTWGYKADEPGVGAFDGTGITVLALPTGRLVVLRVTGDEEKSATLAVDAPIEPAATDLSIVPPLALVVYGGGDAGYLAARRRADATVTRIDARRSDGSLAWQATLPFLAGQPPLDGDGCVYVIGHGIVALGLDGKTLWSTASTVPLRAQAFADGTLAVVRGAELQIVGRDGAIRQSFRAAEELTTYPAIGPDGAVWAASAKTLYVAR